MENKTNGLAVGGLILGIFTILMGCFGWTFGWGTIIGVITGIVGIILSVLGKKQSPSGLATGGLVTSIHWSGALRYPVHRLCSLRWRFGCCWRCALLISS